MSTLSSGSTVLTAGRLDVMGPAWNARWVNNCPAAPIRRSVYSCQLLTSAIRPCVAKTSLAALMKAAVSAYTAPTAAPSKAARPVGGTVRRARTTQATIAVTMATQVMTAAPRSAGCELPLPVVAPEKKRKPVRQATNAPAQSNSRAVPGGVTHVPQDECEDQPADEERLHQRQGAVVQGHDLKADADHVEAEPGEPQRPAQTCEPGASLARPGRPVRRRLLERGRHRRSEGRGQGQPDDEPVHASPPSDPASTGDSP